MAKPSAGTRYIGGEILEKLRLLKNKESLSSEESRALEAVAAIKDTDLDSFDTRAAVHQLAMKIDVSVAEGYVSQSEIVKIHSKVREVIDFHNHKADEAEAGAGAGFKP